MYHYTIINTRTTTPAHLTRLGLDMNINIKTALILFTTACDETIRNAGSLPLIGLGGGNVSSMRYNAALRISEGWQNINSFHGEVQDQVGPLLQQQLGTEPR